MIDETTEEVVYLEVSDWTPGDDGSYPDDDLKALLVEGTWRFVYKDGFPYMRMRATCYARANQVQESV